MLVKKRLNRLEQLNDTISSIINGIQRKKQLNEEQVYRIRLVMNELVVNIFKYSGADEVMIHAEYNERDLRIVLMDNGNGFESASLMERNVTQQELLFQETGRGVFLVKMMTDSLKYSENGNTVDLVLKL